MTKASLKNIGIGLILLCILTAGLIYGPIIYKQLTFKAESSSGSQSIQSSRSVNSAGSLPTPTFQEPTSKEFGLYISKLGLNVPVEKNVSGTDEKEYYQKLKKGVAHYKGTPTPDVVGNTVIFGHSSSVPGISKSDYDQVFLSLDKLQKGDVIDLYYEQKDYQYVVDQVKEVSDSEMNIIKDTKNKQLTLITCWPPGTNLKRLVVVAK